MNRSAGIFALLLTLIGSGISRGEQTHYVVFIYGEAGPIRAHFGRARDGNVKVELAFPGPVAADESVLPLPDGDGMPPGRIFVGVAPEVYRAAKALVEASPAARAAEQRQGLDTRDFEARALERIARYLLGECPDSDRVSRRSLIIRAKTPPTPNQVESTPRDPVEGASGEAGPEGGPSLADALSKRRRMAEGELQQLLATRAADRPRGRAAAEADRAADDARFRQFRAGLDAEAQAALEGSRSRVVGASELKRQVRQQHAQMVDRLEGKLQESRQAVEQSWAKFGAEFAESMAKGDQAAVYLATLLGVPPEFAAAAAALTGASPELAAQLAQSRAAHGKSSVAAAGEKAGETPASTVESTAPARPGPAIDVSDGRGAPSFGLGPLRQPIAPPGVVPLVQRTPSGTAIPYRSGRGPLRLLDDPNLVPPVLGSPHGTSRKNDAARIVASKSTSDARPYRAAADAERLERRTVASIDYGVAFRFGSAVPEQRQLEELAGAYNSAREKMRNPNNVITIYGRASEPGPENYNLDLSDRRARFLRDYLVEHGIDPERIRVVPQGEMHWNGMDLRERDSAYDRIAFWHIGKKQVEPSMLRRMLRERWGEVKSDIDSGRAVFSRAVAPLAEKVREQHHLPANPYLEDPSPDPEKFSKQVREVVQDGRKLLTGKPKDRIKIAAKYTLGSVHDWVSSNKTGDVYARRRPLYEAISTSVATWCDPEYETRRELTPEQANYSSATDQVLRGLSPLEKYQLCLFLIERDRLNTLGFPLERDFHYVDDRMNGSYIESGSNSIFGDSKYRYKSANRPDK